MKRAILHGPGDLRIEERPSIGEDLPDDAIRVRTEISALSAGTDVCPTEHDSELFPRPVGANGLGRVCGVGRAVRRFRVGDRVVGPLPHQSESVVRECEPLVPVAEEVNPEDAVFGNLLQLASAGYRRAHLEPGRNVAVVGLGVVGLGAVALGRLYGARVMAIGNHALRLDAAQRGGAHAVALGDDEDLRRQVEDFGQDRGVDLVVLSASTWDAYRTALAVVAPGGRVALVGRVGYGQPAAPFNPLCAEWLQAKAVSLVAVGAGAGCVDTWREGARHVLGLVEEGRLEPKRLVTHRFHFSELPEAYALAARREKSVLGVVVDWSGAD